MAGPRVSSIILRVSDLEVARDFWGGKLGLEAVGGSGAFAFFEGGGCLVALNAAPGGDSAAGDSLTEIVLEVEDPRAEYERWSEAGVGFEVPLRTVTEQEGKRLVAAHFRDPDGHLVSLTGWV
jgi:catechol 2,3-dioxygenase-like lactoylglutathione lyase family enzyme